MLPVDRESNNAWQYSYNDGNKTTRYLLLLLCWRKTILYNIFVLQNGEQIYIHIFVLHFEGNPLYTRGGFGLLTVSLLLLATH